MIYITSCILIASKNIMQVISPKKAFHDKTAAHAGGKIADAIFRNATETGKGKSSRSPARRRTPAARTLHLDEGNSARCTIDTRMVASAPAREGAKTDRIRSEGPRREQSAPLCYFLGPRKTGGKHKP